MILQKHPFLLLKDGIQITEILPRDEFGEPLNWLNVGTGVDIQIKNLQR